MKKNKNLSGHCKRLVNLLVALLFFFSSHISPVISVARDLAPKQSPLKTEDGPRSGYEELLMAKAMLLSPSVSEMSEALKSLQKEYPRQITLWRELNAQLSERDPKKNQMEEFLNQAQLIFPSIIAYSVRFANEQESIEKALANGKSFPKDVKVYHYIRLTQLLHVREKLAFYEAGSQGILTKLFQIISERWNNPASETFKKVNAFEKLRKGQMAKYLKARKDFDQTRFLILKLEQPLNLRMRLWMWGNIDVSLSLADELTSPIPRKESSSAPIRDEWAKSISKELEQIARHRAKEIMAMDGVFSQDHRESLWSMLYSPPISHEKSDQIRNQGLPQIQMASRLVRSLEAIQPKLKTLFWILTERNRLLRTTPLLKTDLFEHLRNQLVLEESSLARLKEVLQVIENSKRRPDEIIGDMKLSALYEECGFLKEELIDLETLLLSELHVLIQSTPLTSDARWPQVQALLGEEDAWRKSWQSYEVDWKAVVKSFGQYQEDILRRYASALNELNKHMEHLRRTTGSPIDPMGQQFLSFLESIIRKQLEDTQLAIETKRKMIQFAGEDPLYAHLFGVHPNNFWHMYLGQGHIFYSLEQLIIQKNKIMDNSRDLFKEKVSQRQQAFLILQIAKDFGLIQDVGRNQKGYVVVFGSGDHSFILEGLVLSQQPNLYRMPTIKYTSSYWIEMNQIVLNFLSPSMAYAGIGDFFSNLKQNWSIREYRDNLYSQCARNKWNYIVSGALGVVLAIPTGGASLVPLGVQFAADSYIAMTRSVVKAGNPQQWKTLDRYIDHVESLYNIGKVAESLYNIYNRPAVDRAIDRAGENIRKVGSEATEKIQQLARSQRFWETMADDAVNTAINSPGWSDEARRILMDLSEINTERVVAIPREMAEVAQNVTKNVKEIEKTIETLVKATGGISRVVQYTMDTIGSLPDAWSGGEGIAEIGRDIKGELEQKDCSRWPGSIPQWNNQTNRAECFCPPGMVWNRDRTRCIDSRQAAVENTNCSRWPGSVAMWNNQTNRAECFCPQGMVWNQNRTACISARQQPPPQNVPTPTGPPRQVKCNDTAKQGGNTPETLVVDLGRTSGVFRFDYDMYDVPDRMIVHYGGGTYDTQCTGGKQGRGRDKGSVNLQFFGSSQVTIKVLPACQGGSTSWKFTVHCPR